jgi:sugar transferase (PEP-CTERM system associated)
MFKLISRKQVLLLVIDIGLITLCLFSSALLRLGEVTNIFEVYTGGTSLILLSYITILYIADTYNLRFNFISTNYIARFLGANIVASMFSGLTFYLFPYWKYGRGIWLIFTFLCFLILICWRFLFEMFLKSRVKVRNVVIVGVNSAGVALYEAIKNRVDLETKGFIEDNPKGLNRRIDSSQIIGNISSLKEAISKTKADIVVITDTYSKNKALLSKLVDCKMEGKEVYNMPSFFEDILGKLPIYHINDEWIIQSPIFGVCKNVYNLRIKRLLDIGLALLSILFSSLLIILTAIFIKLTSKGPVFYYQKRIGLNGRIFKLIKFRSMHIDAEKDGAKWVRKNDLRVTFVGRIIRKLRIDEIPQFFNVLKGEMSFIGPRPERPEFVEELKRMIPYYTLRHAVRPGITGWAQVNFPYGASVQDAVEKLQYDLFYIKNLTIMLDLRIFLKTIRVVLLGTGGV